MNLEIKDLHVEIEGNEILKGIDLKIEKGETHVIMGPNGSGKSTLSNTIMGHPKYNITKGQLLADGKDITKMKTNERAKLGLFLSFQYPCEVEGVSVSNFLRTALNSVKDEKVSVLDFKKLMEEKMKELGMDKKFGERYLNGGFSGGEKKRNEILQMAILNPKIAILDETDSGLDVDALKAVAEGINLNSDGKGILLITHYHRILKYIKPDHVHIMVDGKIVKSGDRNLADTIEEKGYNWLLNGDASGD